MTELKYQPDPRLERALDILFILHADHEQNCSTNAVRAVGSSQVDPYSAVAAGVAALYGPLHGGANEAVLRMLRRIERVENIPDFIEGVKAGDEKLMGFGHRVYKNYDPRAKIIKAAADDVFEVTGTNPLLDIALELEKIALEDEYFVKRKLYPNVDFYSGLIYEALGMPVDDVPRPVRHPAHERLAGAVAGDDRRLRAEDRAAAPDLHGRPREGLRGRGEPELAHTPPGMVVVICNDHAHPPARQRSAGPDPGHPPDDKAELQNGLKRLSVETIHKRFLAAKPRFSSSELQVPDRGRRPQPHRAGRGVGPQRAASSPWRARSGSTTGRTPRNGRS